MAEPIDPRGNPADAAREMMRRSGLEQDEEELVRWRAFCNEPHLPWKLIDTCPKEEDEEYIVGWLSGGAVWVTRAAWWSDGSLWREQAEDSQEDAAGWWTANHSVTQEKIEPTHWLMARPSVEIDGEQF